MEYINNDWKELLEFNHLVKFEDIWNLKADWFEEPNVRRGGWSGVCKISLKQKDGPPVSVFLKRQENHTTKTFRHPVSGISTFEREFKNILSFRANHLPTVDPLYFGSRKFDGNIQAILMTRDLEGYEPLDSPLFARDGAIMQNKDNRQQIMTAVATVMRNMHSCRFRHNCFYAKHVFIKALDDGWDVKIIDLEKLNKSIAKETAMMRDLYTLPRRLSGWGYRDRLRFLKIYLQEEKLSSNAKSIFRKIDKRMQLKNKLIVD